MKKIIRSKMLILSVVVAVVLSALLWKICPIMFQNNDDKFLLYMIAGYTTGTPDLHTVFGGFLWAGFISLFYKIYAGITWYTVITLGVILLSLVLICRALIPNGKRVYKILGIIIFTGLYFITLCYFTAAIQYTVTAAYVGVAGVCALLLSSWTEEKKERIAYIVISAIMITTSYGIRKEMGLVTMSCVAIVLFFMLLKSGRSNSIRALCVIAVAFAIVYTSNAVYEKVTGLAEFNQNYSIVQRWIDYPHVDIEDDTNGVYESVGWDKALYDAATEWFFLDERVSPENIQIINDESAKMETTLSERIDRAVAALATKQMVNVQVLIWIFILGLGNLMLARVKKNRNDVLEILAADALFLFFMALAFYFCFLQGRFPLRVYQALVIIYFVPSLAILVRLIDKYELKKTFAAIAVTMLVAVPLCYKCYPAGSMVYQAKLATHDTDRQEIIGQVTALERYAADNKSNLYIYDYELSQPSAPFVNFGNDMPYNVLFWGGWTYDSPVYYKQLEANGLTELKPEDLVDGNVFLCGKSVDETIKTYMESVFGELDIEIIDNVGDIMIYRYCSK